MTANLLTDAPAVRPASKRRRPAAAETEMAPVVNGVCSEHRVPVGLVSRMCGKCVGYGLLKAGWRPAHLLTDEEIDAWLAVNEQLPRTRRGYGQERD